MSRKRFLRGASPGQAVVEAAFAFMLMVILFTGAVSVGQMINYSIGLDNAAGEAATAAAEQADTPSGNPSNGAVAAVNTEQATSAWTACGSSAVAPCVTVTSANDSTGSGTTVKVERVTLTGSYSPVFSVLGITIPVSVTAAAAT